jgi:hypothetical protein
MTQHEGSVAPAGTLGLKVVRGDGTVEFPSSIPPYPWPAADRFSDMVKHASPAKHLPDEVNDWRRRNRKHFARRFRKVTMARALGIPTFYGALYLEVIRGNGRRLPFGLASVAVVTTVGVNFIVDAFQNTTELENMKFHGFGTGGSAEAVGNTALTTELTTAYATDNTRPTGSQTENGANVYRTVATLDPDSDVGITEHGIFDQAATGGGVLLDRSLFSVINLVGATGDTLQATYDFTVTSGG